MAAGGLRSSVTLYGALSAIAYAILAWASTHQQHVPVPLFLGCVFTASAAALLLLHHLRHQRFDRSVLRQIVVWAVLFRSIGFVGVPIYEDDFYRYLWDGRTFALSGDPYAHAPADSFGDDSLPDKFQNILSRVNYPEVKTIYGPIPELAFLAAYTVSPGALWPLKLIFLLADLSILWLLWKIAGDSPYLLLYAWSPLVIKEVAFTAHTDILAALFLVAGAYLLKRGRTAAGGANLAIAVASKVVALCALPVLLWRRKWFAWAAAAATLAVLYVPFLLRGSSEFGGLGTFAAGWEFNSLGFALLKWTFGFPTARNLWPILFGLFCVWYLHRYRDQASVVVMFGVFFLLAPVVNPWYLLIMAPFVVLRPEPWSICLLQTVLLSYVTAGNLQTAGASLFEHPVWVRPAEALPIAIAVVWQWQALRMRRPAHSPLHVETKGAIP